MATITTDASVTTDAQSIEKFGTPLPPNDPASQQGVRDNPNYIGATNFATIQSKYTPYQIEQSTTRDAQGNVFWKSGVDINSIPKSAPISPLSVGQGGTPTDQSIIKGSSSNTSTLYTPATNDSLSSAISGMTSGYLDGISKRLDEMTAMQQSLIESKKAAAETNRNSIIDTFKGMIGSSSNQDSLANDRKLFQVTETINALNTVKQKLADATSALNQGLIYEENQPVRMALLVGRSSELKKQGLAQIGALQSTAEILQGNLDLAKAYADQSLSAIKSDNADKLTALDTLLNLYNDDLTDLTKDEKDLIDYRKSLLEDENKRLDDNRDKMLELAQSFPNSFASGGATFMDSPEEAIKKMLPYLSEQEKLKVEALRADLNKKITSGTTTNVDPDLYQQMADDVQKLRDAKDENGNRLYSESQINLALISEYGSKFSKRTDLTSVIDQLLQGADKQTTPTQDVNDKLSQWQLDQLNNGSAEIIFDPVSGKPTIAQKEQPTDKKPGIIDSFLKWWSAD